MIPIPQSPNYRKNVAAYTAFSEPCIVCGKAIKDANRVRYLAITIYMEALLPSEIDTYPSDKQQGCFPIGPDCARKHPELKPYLRTFADPADEGDPPSGDYWMAGQYIGI
jgi:hypothetical protein